MRAAVGRDAGARRAPEGGASGREELSVLAGGAGGQGVLSLGLALAHAAVASGRSASWLPSYGAEQRGGTATAMVVVADGEVICPYVARADVGVFLNAPSYLRFLPRVRAGGMALYDASLIGQRLDAPRIRQVGIRARELAAAAGEERAANMVLLGALLALVPVVPLTAVRRVLPLVLPDRHHHLLRINERALLAGAEAGRASAGTGAGAGRASAGAGGEAGRAGAGAAGRAGGGGDSAHGR